jgi:LDH2 family malate/lactate/ureidoglycolate dehydrogenase
MRASATVVDSDRLEKFAATLLERLGLLPEPAATAAQVLVRTDRRGVRTHGVHMLPRYAAQIEEGGIDPRGLPSIVRETASTALVDGGGTLGQVVAHYATEVAIAKAVAHDVGFVSVRNSSHLGACGHYALMCAEAGVVGLAFSNTPVIMRTSGSRGRVLGNGPTAWGAPSGAGFPLVFDAAMSVVAGQKVIQHLERGQPLPAGWIIDAEGLPSTDPHAFRAGGALVPIGDHKGAALALLGEVLTGVMSGGPTLAAVWNGGNAKPPEVSHSILALNVEVFQPLAEFEERMAGLVAEIHRAEPAPGYERVMVPGEIEHEAEQRALREGLEFDPVAWDLLLELARRLEVEPTLEAARQGG